MTQFFNAIVAKCKALSAKKEAEIIDNQIAKLQSKKNALIGNKQSEKKSSEIIKKSQAQVTCNKDDLIINVASNVLVKDVCRNIERKLGRNISANNADDFQLLYNHLHYYYALKHINTLPQVIGRNKTYHIDDYVRHRTYSVINDTTCHVSFK